MLYVSFKSNKTKSTPKSLINTLVISPSNRSEIDTKCEVCIFLCLCFSVQHYYHFFLLPCYTTADKLHFLPVRSEHWNYRVSLVVVMLQYCQIDNTFSRTNIDWQHLGKPSLPLNLYWPFKKKLIISLACGTLSMDISSCFPCWLSSC